MEQGTAQPDSATGDGPSRGARDAAHQFRVAWRDRPTIAQRIALVIIGLIIIGLVVILGTVALIVGAAFAIVVAIGVLIQRGLAKLRGGGGSSPGDTLRKNVRVIRRDGG